MVATVAMAVMEGTEVQDMEVIKIHCMEDMVDTEVTVIQDTVDMEVTRINTVATEDMEEDTEGDMEEVMAEAMDRMDTNLIIRCENSLLQVNKM
ncbi:uncharacterized protein LOC120421297 isoform X2 [Culex pipiens pallens]|uniref:uncharacterized protein LOC120421297 isoform X2 n=1 Tax=Culex pipiens pallens TaxID=42434 RepID=UPI0022AAB2A6|nr:uncharacterized protein LOC120421297 isoform X2 [Culex pipiens pallens]